MWLDGSDTTKKKCLVEVHDAGDSGQLFARGLPVKAGAGEDTSAVDRDSVVEEGYWEHARGTVRGCAVAVWASAERRMRTSRRSS